MMKIVKYQFRGKANVYTEVLKIPTYLFGLTFQIETRVSCDGPGVTPNKIVVKVEVKQSRKCHIKHFKSVKLP